jgi:hypothetical protein
MSITHNIAEILADQVTLEVESIDRMYLNVYVPRLQYPRGVAGFFRYHRGHPIASSVLMQPISKQFIADMKTFAKQHGVPERPFEKGECKEEIAATQRASFTGTEGIILLGKAQEKAPVFRTERRLNPNTGSRYPWIVESTAMVNQYYWYCVDDDFGPFFLKFCSYFPYNAKLCLNGHEYAKRQLTKEGIGYQALDNGFLSCEDPQRLQQICEELSADKIDALARKWLEILPHPYTQADHAAGYQYDVSILQAEFSLTQILDRPRTGRILFEQLIRENLDLGRPDQVQLVFHRRVTRRTPGYFRTRVITDGVTPSIHVDYKQARIKQYHKEGRGFRTETTINNPRDFDLGKRLPNLPALREIGFQANRRLLRVETISHNCRLGEDAFQQVQSPVVVDGQRASGLRFADVRVQALLQTLVLFCHLPRGFSNRELREPLAQLLGMPLSDMTQGRMTYDLRRLRLHQLIQRLPHSNRYQVTEFGLKVAVLFTRTYARVLRTGLAELQSTSAPADSKLATAFLRLKTLIDQQCAEAQF